ncbi:iduronate sulfatase [Clostridium beijerinckii]|uniref:Iduronate sulfatase n=1 Tax=Clostridium beijerinckii TaxID=1520 RepID=A0AAX0B5D3_CLOBE|nr:iduronate sulfatase [Clostridium beijerinckii]MBA8935886.1 hypothetical protein [Clostridium beijerinckii]NRT32662.1 hypothetical protein [Clostridium beijerinckii]NRT34152.1 hypothetical protein [Clostridium beijerinckii]NRT46419.1 hypothetical protein [Clostridium beijerinckii]NRT47910.1 hypothetical protein [Clostridium beijerinckii]
MEQTTINLINSLGYPIAVSVALGFFIYKMWNRISITLDKVTDTNNTLVLTNQSLIQKVDNKIDKIEEKVDTIADKMSK